MSARVVDVVDEWGEQSFTGGYRTLNELAGEEFSGVCRAGGAELYMTSGTVVGVLQGSIEDFEGSEGTTYEAPSPALPLLAVMQERSEEVRAQYYTEDTPITEVDRTLSDGGFSGYLELSENVLSGDYYLVYYAGRSMSVAFVGASSRLVTGDEAFETADDEVGIYEVRSVDIEPIEVPEPASDPDPESEPAATAGTTTEADAEADTETTETETADAGSGPSTPEPESEPEPGAESEPEQTGTATTGPDKPGGESRRQRSGSSTNNGPGTATGRAAATDDGSATDLHLETRAIPSLDPDLTAPATTAGASSGGDAGERVSTRQPAESRGQEDRTEQTEQPKRSNATERDQQATAAGSGTDATVDQPAESDRAASGVAGSERIEELETELDQRESTIERLEAELEGAQEEQGALEAELDSVREERDELAAEVERLDSQLEQLESEFGAARDADQRLTPAAALDGTDIFIRYGSKGKATLEKAHDGGPRKEKVDENLRLEKHTQFDAAAAAVGGQGYDAFLEGTMEFQFVRWVVRELLFEIRETGHTNGLADLYDALPKIDRAELSGAVTTTYTEDGQETRSQESFDVVLRDRMGDALLVANLNDSREAATQSMMEGLITAAERVGQSAESFAGAFLVTRSFFEPAALETASEATKGGLLSRDKRESFVNLSRKRGYHLCLVEARKQQFNLAVPDL